MHVADAAPVPVDDARARTGCLAKRVQRCDAHHPDAKDLGGAAFGAADRDGDLVADLAAKGTDGVIGSAIDAEQFVRGRLQRPAFGPR